MARRAGQSGGSPDPLYQRWIDMYPGEEYQAVVDAVLEVADRIGAQASEHELNLMRRHRNTTARHEWMVWEAAYRMADWPVSTGHSGGAPFVAALAGPSAQQVYDL